MNWKLTVAQERILYFVEEMGAEDLDYDLADSVEEAPEFLGSCAAAEFLGVGATWLNALVSAGRVRVDHLEVRTRFFARAELESYLKKKKVARINRVARAKKRR